MLHTSSAVFFGPFLQCRAQTETHLLKLNYQNLKLWNQEMMRFDLGTPDGRGFVNLCVESVCKFVCRKPLHRQNLEGDWMNLLTYSRQPIGIVERHSIGVKGDTHCLPVSRHDALHSWNTCQRESKVKRKHLFHIENPAVPFFYFNCENASRFW